MDALPVPIAWNKPTNMQMISAFEIQWPNGNALVNSNQTNFTIPNLGVGASQPVSVRSVASNGKVSDPDSIQVFNVITMLEKSVNGFATWTPVSTNWFTHQRSTNVTEFFRVKVVINSN